MDVRILGSGSSGNSILIRSGKTNILIDAGLSANELERKLLQAGVSPNQVDALLITHEHHDHIKGLKLFLKRYRRPLFASEESLLCGGLSVRSLVAFFRLESGRPFQIGSLEIEPFSLPHDAAETFGFSIRADGLKLALATDLGFASKLVKERMKDSNILIIEANHDLDMLRKGPYPWFLKQRLMSQQGHLSNKSMGNLVEEVIHSSTRYLILAHLSEINNRPEYARKEAWEAACRKGIQDLKLIVSSPEGMSESIQW